MDQDLHKFSIKENASSAELEEYISILSEHQQGCEKQGKYVEADIAKQRVSELKRQLHDKRREELLAKQQQEKQEIEQAHLDEFNQFNEFWDSKMDDYNNEAQNIERNLILRHEEEMNRINEELEKTVPYKPKESTEVLNLRKIEEHLAKQKNYTEAHQVQQKRMILEKDENTNWQNARANKIKNQLLLLKSKQDNELNALKKKVAAGSEEQRKNRSFELERLLQKYQNLKKDLEVKQQMELLAFEKQFKTKAVTSVTKSSGSRVLNPKFSNRN